MQLYKLPTDFSIATGKRRTIGYFTWKRLSPWAMEVCNPSTASFRHRSGIPFPKPVFSIKVIFLRRRQCAWEAWGANLLCLAIHHQRRANFQLSKLIHRIPGTSTSDDSWIIGTLSNVQKKIVDSWRLQDFNWAFVCDVFLRCCVFAEKMPIFNDVSGDRASNRRPLKFPVLSIAIGPHHLFIQWSSVLEAMFHHLECLWTDGEDGILNKMQNDRSSKRIESDMNLAQHWSFLLAFHCTREMPTAGGYMSQLAVNNRQDHLDENRSRRSIGCCNSCESQAGTPFRLARLKDKPQKLCYLLVQSFRILSKRADKNKRFFSKTTSTSYSRWLGRSILSWRVLAFLEASTRRQRQRHCRSLSRWCTCSRVAFLPLHRWMLSRGETNRPWKMLDSPRSGIIWHHRNTNLWFGARCPKRRHDAQQSAIYADFMHSHPSP